MDIILALLLVALLSISFGFGGVSGAALVVAQFSAVIVFILVLISVVINL